MTYCVGVLGESGLVFASDRRTNAGVDHIASVRKMFVFEEPGERVVVLMTAGNLAITQAVVSLLEEACRSEPCEFSLMTVPTMFQAARVVGDTLREVHRRDGEHLQQQGIGFSAGLLLGGQIKGEPPRLFQIYEAGNFIEASPEMPFLQIGETKYGKPVLDRLLASATSLEERAKCVVVSFTPTIRSNLSVGLPLDLLCYETDSLKVTCRKTLEERDPYFDALDRGWGEALAKAFAELPPPPLT